VAQGATGPAADLLAEGTTEQRPMGSSLLLPPDAIPTLSVLASTEGPREGAEFPMFLPIIIASTDPSQPATFVDLPPTAVGPLSVHAKGYAVPWARLLPSGTVRLPSMPPPAAIRFPSGPAITDAELLVPVTTPALSCQAGGSLTWLLFCSEWRSEELEQTIEGLSVQIGAENHRMVLVGPIDGSVHGLANSLFKDRIMIVRDSQNVVAELSTLFVCYVGSGVILHDNRSAALLTDMLSDPEIASATCALVAAERRGKNWHASIADAGEISGATGSGTSGWPSFAQVLWRTSFPVSKPPVKLWVARSRSVKKWLGMRPPQRLTAGTHVCTTLITASYFGSGKNNASEVRVPPAPDERATKIRALFG
jgi:hypothetical protein